MPVSDCLMTFCCVHCVSFKITYILAMMNAGLNVTDVIYAHDCKKNVFIFSFYLSPFTFKLVISVNKLRLTLNFIDPRRKSSSAWEFVMLKQMYYLCFTDVTILLLRELASAFAVFEVLEIA